MSFPKKVRRAGGRDFSRTFSNTHLCLHDVIFCVQLQFTFVKASTEQASAKLPNLLGKLLSCKRLTTDECDIVKHQFETAE